MQEKSPSLMERYEAFTKQTDKVTDLFYEYRLGARPFLKWAGGKRQLLDTFQECYPAELKMKNIKNYYEPFVGGGAVFFDIAQNYEIENAYLYDRNAELILTYRVIQRDVDKLIEYLSQHAKNYQKLDEEKRTAYYYAVREKFNAQRFRINYNAYTADWIPRAAQIIFLNKTCFNGLFRFNSRGGFNTPIGRYKNPKILDAQNLLNASKLLERATLKNIDFSAVKRDLGERAFVYFDPPYRPISKTANFTAYSKFTFQDEEQSQLAQLFRDLDQQGALLMLSNSDPRNVDPEDNFFDKLYSAYNIRRVNAKRAINATAKKRNPIKEIVVTNY